MPIEPRVSLVDEIPDVRTGRAASRQEPSIEFFHSGVDVIWIEHNGRDDSLVCVDLEYVEDLDKEWFRPPIAAAEVARPGQNKTFPTESHEVFRQVREADIDGCPHVVNDGFATVTAPTVHCPAAIIEREILCQTLTYAVPIARDDRCSNAFRHKTCRTRELVRRSREFVESRERRFHDHPRRRSRRGGSGRL